MADQKTSELTELTTPADGDFIPIVDVSETVDENKNKKISRENLTGWHFLTTPLTSTSWDGDSFSTTAKTLIDLSAVFGVPAGVKAVMVYIAWQDSASSTSNCYVCLSPNNVAGSGIFFGAYGQGNDKRLFNGGIVPCDANGDIYYQIKASGADTMDVWLEVWGYWL